MAAYFLLLHLYVLYLRPARCTAAKNPNRAGDVL
jgi:hypothetical protein